TTVPLHLSTLFPYTTLFRSIEYQEEGDAPPHRDRNGLEPGVLAELPHEIRDVQRRRDVEPEVGDQRDVHHGRDEDREDLPQLPTRHERLVGKRRVAPAAPKDADARGADQQSDVEREVAGLRPVLAPARTQPEAVEHHDQAKKQDYRGDADLHRARRRRRTICSVFQLPPSPIRPPPRAAS